MSRKPFLIIAVLSLWGAVACSSPTEQDSAVRDGSDEIIEGGETGFDALQVGDCWNDGTTEVIVNTVDTVACTDPHDNQMVGRTEFEDQDWPGKDESIAMALAQCIDGFDSILDEAGNEDLAFFPISPTEESWDAGDREVICSVYAVDLTKLSEDRLG